MMLEVIVKQNVIIYVMGALFGLGILAKLVSVFTARRLVREAKDIHNSNHRLMKLVKAKFEHASMVSDRVQNVSAFVNKFMYEYKIVGIRLQTYQSFSSKMMWGIGVLGLFAIFESHRLFRFGEQTIQYIQWTSIFFLILAVLQLAREERVYLQATQNYMVEYLENVCMHRYLKRSQAEEIQAAVSKPEQVEIEEAVQEEEVKLAVLEEEEERKKSEQEMRIRAILEEFLA